MSQSYSYQIKELCTVKRGGSPRPIEKYLITKDGSGYNWLLIGDIENDADYIEKTGQKISKEGLSKTTLVKANELILSNSMSFGRPYITKIETCIHDGWLALKDIKHNLINTKYFYYLLKSTAIQKKFNNLSAGSGVKNLKREIVENILIKIPDLETQQKIVQIIDDTNKYLTLLKQKAILEKRKEAKLAKMLLSKSDYEITTLGSLCDYEQPQKYLVSDVACQKGDTPILTANKAFVLGYTNETNGIYEARNNPIVLLDDFTCDCKYVDFNFKIKSSAIKILKPKKNTSAIILYWTLKNISMDISGEHKRHYLSELINKKVPIIDNMASKNISNILKLEKEIINNIKKEICKTEIIYKYLLNHLISGDFDLTNIKLENGKEQQ